MKSDVDRIVTIMKDKKYLEDLGVTPKDIIKAIRMAQDEFKELEQIVNNLNNNNECFKSVCEKLKGHNEYFDAIYPDHNYFDLNYKSLLVTVIQPINENNVKTSMKVSKKDVYIYPNNISKVNADEIVTVDFNENMDLDKAIEEKYINETYSEIVELFMNEDDKSALEKLYEMTKDKLVKILLDWKEEYELTIDENYTDSSGMYNDIMEYVWEKYHLNEIQEEEEELEE